MAALEPGHYDEMIAEVRRALYRFMPGRNGDPKAGLAYTLITLIGQAEETLHLSKITHDMFDGSITDWLTTGEATKARQVVHAIYRTLVQTHVIKPDHPEKEKT